MNDTFSVPSELQNEWPDPARLRQQILTLYCSQTNTSLSTPSPTDDEMEEIVKWLNKHAVDMIPRYFRLRSVQVPVFSPTLSAKANALAHLHCPVCETKDGLFPVKIMSIRISPKSKQAMNQRPGMTAAFGRAIAHRFKEKKIPFEPDNSVCLTIVFVVKGKGAQKDLDNMAKAIIDAVKTILFGDDRKIDHLNILRIKSPDEEFVWLNIRKTTLNQRDDVLVRRMLHSWGGAPELNIEDFM